AYRDTKKGDVARGIPVSNKSNSVTFEELAADVVKDYVANGHKSFADIEARFRLHLLPFFGHMKASEITTAHFKAYRIKREQEGARQHTIKRELEAAKRAFNLAYESTPPKILYIPYIPMPKAVFVRQGFFERDQFDALCCHLPDHLV